jgi:CDGSH iron-sulfur domain-containing protein 3
MADRIVAGCAPVVGILEAGTYYWCACGRSKTQPYCDGSHEGTGIEPIELVIDAPKKVALCTCKMTKRPPICDGSHKVLAPSAVGLPVAPPAQP